MPTLVPGSGRDEKTWGLGLKPSGAFFFAFFGGKVSLSSQPTKKGCTFFPWPLGLVGDVGTFQVGELQRVQIYI